MIASVDHLLLCSWTLVLALFLASIFLAYSRLVGRCTISERIARTDTPSLPEKAIKKRRSKRPKQELVVCETGDTHQSTYDLPAHASSASGQISQPKAELDAVEVPAEVDESSPAGASAACQEPHPEPTPSSSTCRTSINSNDFNATDTLSAGSGRCEARIDQEIMVNEASEATSDSTRVHCKKMQCSPTNRAFMDELIDNVSTPLRGSNRILKGRSTFLEKRFAPLQQDLDVFMPSLGVCRLPTNEASDENYGRKPSLVQTPPREPLMTNVSLEGQPVDIPSTPESYFITWPRCFSATEEELFPEVPALLLPVPADASSGASAGGVDRSVVTPQPASGISRGTGMSAAKPARMSQQLPLQLPPKAEVDSTWSWFRVTYRGGVQLRTNPSFDAMRTNVILAFNETFVACEEVLGPDYRRYLRLADGRGWAFDDAALHPQDPSVVRVTPHPITQQPQQQQQQQQRTAEPQAVLFSQPAISWFYVAYLGGIQLRAAPNFEAPRTGATLPCNDVFPVDKMLQGKDGRIYLHLADSQGWVFDDTSLHPADPSVKRCLPPKAELSSSSAWQCQKQPPACAAVSPTSPPLWEPTIH